VDIDISDKKLELLSFSQLGAMVRVHTTRSSRLWLCAEAVVIAYRTFE
jgi:hypothetical protein